MTQTDPTEPGRDLRAVPDNDDPRAVAEAILFEVRRVIVGQDAMLERILVGLLSRWPHPARGRPGPGQDADDQDARRRPRRIVQARPVHAGPHAVGPRRHAHLPPVRRLVPDGARAGVRELPPRRRDQPRAGQGPVRPPRGHAGAAGHDRWRHARRPGAVHRPRDGEPDRGRGHLPAARGPGRPVHAQDRPRLPTRRPRRRRSSPARSAPACRRARSSMPTGLAALQRRVEDVYVDPRIISYAVGLVEATRRLEYWGAPELASYVSYGASPRGSINLVHGARALALLRGRRYVLPSDVAELAPDVLRHRLVLSYAALTDGITPDSVVERVLGLVPAPQPRPRGGRRRNGPRGHRVTGDLARVGGRDRSPGPAGTRPDRRRARPAARDRADPSRGWPADRRPSRPWPRRGARPRSPPALRARRRRPPDRLERHRPQLHPAGPRGRAGSPADRVARARPVGLDALRDGRPAQGRRGRGRGARRRSVRRPALATGSASSRSGRPASASRHLPADATGCSACCGPSRPTPPEEGAGATTPGTRPAHGRRVAHEHGSRGDRVRLPRAARLAPRPDRGRRPPHGPRDRDRRPARGRARRRRGADARSTPRPDARSASTPPTDDSARRSAKPPPPSARPSPRSSRRLGIRHLRLSTQGAWLPAFARALDTTGRPT